MFKYIFLPIYIYIYVAYSRPNDWNDWAAFFCGHSWVKRKFKIVHGQRRAPQTTQTAYLLS